jgi:hypothetical protein
VKSPFWHTGINNSIELQNKQTKIESSDLRAPRVKQDESIEFKPLPDHHDPDSIELTYGEPWG